MLIIYLFHPFNLISRLISWQTRSKYSHAAIGDGEFVWEAVGAGVKRYTTKEFLAHYKGRKFDSFIAMTPTDGAERAAVEFLNKQVGKKYDFTMIIRFLTRQQATRESRGKWFCSELVYAALEKGCSLVLERVEPWQVSPAMLSYSPFLFPSDHQSMTQKERLAAFKTQYRFAIDARNRGQAFNPPNPKNYGFVSQMDQWLIEKEIGLMEKQEKDAQAERQKKLRRN